MAMLCKTSELASPSIINSKHKYLRSLRQQSAGTISRLPNMHQNERKALKIEVELCGSVD